MDIHCPDLFVRGSHCFQGSLSDMLAVPADASCDATQLRAPAVKTARWYNCSSRNLTPTVLDGEFDVNDH